MYRHKTFVKTNRKDLAVIGTTLANLWNTELESIRILVSQVTHHLVIEDKDLFTDTYDELVKLAKYHRIPMNFKNDGPKFETSISRPAIIVKMFQLKNLDINLVLSYVDNDAYNSDLNDTSAELTNSGQSDQMQQLTDIVTQLAQLVQVQAQQAQTSSGQISDLTNAVRELTKRVESNEANTKLVLKRLSTESDTDVKPRFNQKRITDQINRVKPNNQKNTQPVPSS